ncbi:MAG TPA: MJ0042-type zinc finger domain-containing protein [Myxococcales bacterium]|nr:MJ0042-type zinc finger domain-containing protein [Myxococcales bacterium]
MLVRCARCHAVYSVQDGLAGPVARTFAVECGRCLAVFDVHSSYAPDGPRSPPPRRISTPPPPQRPAAVALTAGSASSNGRRLNGDDEVGVLRPAIYGPVAKHNPLTKGGAIALTVLVLGGLVTLFVLNRPRIPREAEAVADDARAALLLDDDGSLDRAAALFADASRLARGAASFDADRALALLLRGSAKRDVAERLETSRDPGAVAEREAALRDSARLIQEGAAAANAALQRDRTDAAAQRSVALAAALTSGNPRTWLDEAAEHTSADDPLLTLVRAHAELAGGRDGAAAERAGAELSAAKQAEPRLLRAQVDAAALALDRRDLAAARQDLQAVLEVNPKHERAKRLLSLVPP